MLPRAGSSARGHSLARETDAEVARRPAPSELTSASSEAPIAQPPTHDRPDRTTDVNFQLLLPVAICSPGRSDRPSQLMLSA